MWRTKTEFNINVCKGIDNENGENKTFIEICGFLCNKLLCESY